MRAITVATYGAPLVLSEVPDPVVADDQEVVEMLFSAVNPLDIWVSRGNFAGITPQPHIPGVEGVGTRADGSVVIVNGGGIGVAAPGTYAERVAVPTNALIEVPEGVGPQQAAAVSVAGVTAWMCVEALAQVTAGDTVLVLGASGGVGGVALQIARNAGAVVLGQTSSPAKAAAIEATGASAVVAATAADLGAALAGRVPTAVIDGLGGSFTGACVELVAPGGVIVNFGTSSDTAVAFDMRTFYRKGTRLLGYGGLLLTPEQRAKAYESLLAGIAADRIRVPIDAVLPLADAAEAHRRILAKEVEGKLLLDPSR